MFNKEIAHTARHTCDSGSEGSASQSVSQLVSLSAG